MEELQKELANFIVANNFTQEQEEYLIIFFKRVEDAAYYDGQFSMI